MIHRLMLAVGAAAALAGCSLTLPVTGQLTDGSETFAGSATGYTDGGGTIEIVSSKGTKCGGTFVYVTKRDGSGTFTCSDGQSGPFTFVSTGKRGTGSGMIGRRSITFTFG